MQGKGVKGKSGGSNPPRKGGASQARHGGGGGGGGSSSASPAGKKKGRFTVAPKSSQKQHAIKIQKKLTANINRNIEETLAAKASAIKPLNVLQPLAKVGQDKLARDPKAGMSGRGIKGIGKK